MTSDYEYLINFALFLAIITVGYNIVEGFLSVYFGLEDETLALFGFGLDSFVEVISGVGIWHLIMRIRVDKSQENRDQFERQALTITGFAFYLLSAGLFILSVTKFIYGARPSTTFWGIIISAVSIIVMGWLIYYKKRVGRKLNSAAMISDANCTKVCMQLSFILMASSIGYEIFQIGSIDILGSVMIAGISFREGREAFEKANNQGVCC